MKTDFPKIPLPFPKSGDENKKLALYGGPPVIPINLRKTIFPITTKEDILRMILSLSDTSQNIIDDFSDSYRRYIGANYAIPTSSGTFSIMLALIGVGVKPGDEVIIPAFTFIATAQAVVAAKAIPIFVDIDPKTYCIDPKKIENKIGKKTTAIMPVHLHGLPANINLIKKITSKYNLKLVEDASHAHSSTYSGKLCGSLGDAAGQSLMADKNFPVGGEGGITLFKEKEAFDRASNFLKEFAFDHDISWIVAAYGRSQLDRLPYYDTLRARNAQYLTETLSQTKLFLPPFVPKNSTHSYNMYRIKLNLEETELKDIPSYKIKEAVSEMLKAEGVPAREWQNRPIPGHNPFKNKIGYGKSYPFSLGDYQYDQNDYPETLKMLESTFVLCREIRSPIEYERIISYANAFKKIDQNHHLIRELIDSRTLQRPYEKDGRLG